MSEGLAEHADMGKPLILYAEDEPLIAALLEDTLRHSGFEVMVAADGASAAGAIEKYGPKLAGFVTDIQLDEGPDGWELARSLRAINPNIPVVYTTGDSAYLWGSEGVPQSIVVQKPFVVAQVVTGLSNLLNDRDCS